MSLSKNTIWNLAGAGLPLVVGAVTIPFLMNKLGIERFGILTLLWAIIGYFSLFDFGLGRAITQQVAASLGAGRLDEIPGLIKMGVKFTFLTGLAGALILVIASYPLGYKGLNVSVPLQQETFYSLLIAALGIPLATVSSGLRGALEAYEHFFASNIAKIFLGVSIFFFPVIGVFFYGKSLLAVTSFLILARLLSCFLYWYLVSKLPCGNIAKGTVDIGMRKKLFSFGIWMTASNLISPLLVNMDRFIISYLLGATMVAYYTVPFEFLVRMLILPGAIGATLLPRLARDFTIDSKAARTTFNGGVKITSIIMFLLCLAAAILAYPLMKHFLSADFADKSWILVLILSLGVFVNGIAYMPYTALHALGYAKPTGILHITEFIVYIPLLFLLVKIDGLEGAAIAWLIRATVDCFGLFYLCYDRINRDI